jgi:transposase
MDIAIKMPSTSQSQRIFAPALSTNGVSSCEIADMLGIHVRTVWFIIQRAIERGYNLQQCPIQIEDRFVADTPCNGRPRKSTEATQE